MTNPADAGNKDHADRTEAGDLLRVMSGATGHQLRVQSQVFGGIVDQFLKAFVGQSRVGRDWVAEGESGFVQASDRISFEAEAHKHRIDLVGIQIAQLQPQLYPAGNHVVGSRLGLEPTYGTDLPAFHAGDHLIRFLDEPGRGEHRVVTLVHGCGSGMVRKSLDGHLRVQDADNPFHHANLDLLLFQRATLLDVQFQISGYASRLAARLGQPVRIAPDESGSIAYGLAAPRDGAENSLLQSRSNGPTTYRDAFFVLENHDLERVTQGHMILSQDLGHLNRRKRSHVAIEVAAFRDRIDVRTDQQGLQRGIAARTRPHDISRSIDRDLQLGVPHQAGHVLAA